MIKFFKNKLKKLEFANIIFLLLLSFFSIVYFSSTRINVLYATSWGPDQASHMQAIYNTSRGDILQESIAFNPGLPIKNFNYLITRFAPIIIIPSLIYKLFPSLFVLMIFEVTLICLAAVPLYVLAKIKLKSKILPLVVVYAYFMNPIISLTLLQEYRAPMIAIFFFFCAFLFLETRKVALMYLSLFLATLTQEQSSLYVGLFGLWLIFSQRKNKFWKHGLILFLLGLVFFLLIILVIQPCLLKFLAFPENPSLDNNLSAFGRLDGLVNSLLTGQSFNLLILQRIDFFVTKILGPLAFLPILTPVVLIGVPEIAQNIVLNGIEMQYYWHAVYFSLFSVISLVYVLSKIKSKKIKNFLTCVLIISISYFGLAPLKLHFSCFNNYGFKNLWTNNTSWYRCLKQIKDSLPEDSSLVSQTQTLILLSDRKRLYWDITFWRGGDYEKYLPDYFLINDEPINYFERFKQPGEAEKFSSIFISNYEFVDKVCFFRLYKNKN